MLEQKRGEEGVCMEGSFGVQPYEGGRAGREPVQDFSTQEPGAYHEEGQPGAGSQSPGQVRACTQRMGGCGVLNRAGEEGLLVDGST